MTVGMDAISGIKRTIFLLLLFFFSSLFRFVFCFVMVGVFLINDDKERMLESFGLRLTRYDHEDK